MSECMVMLGEGVVTIKRGTSSLLVEAMILGIEQDAVNKQERVYLDRLVHKVDDKFPGWQVSGAISTILTRELRSN